MTSLPLSSLLIGKISILSSFLCHVCSSQSIWVASLDFYEVQLRVIIMDLNIPTTVEPLYCGHLGDLMEYPV